MNNTATRLKTVASAEEYYVNMPLKLEVKCALLARAAANGRPAGREAAAIVTKTVMRGKLGAEQLADKHNSTVKR
jgi:hypothetical protein